MVRILFFTFCVALFAAPQSSEAQIFRRFGGQTRRFAPQPQAQPQHFRQPQAPPQFQQPVQPVQPRYTRGPNQSINRIPAPNGVAPGVAVINPTTGQVVNGTQIPSTVVPSPVVNPQLPGIEIQGQFDPVIQTSSELLDLSGQIQPVNGTQPVPTQRPTPGVASVLNSSAPGLMPAEIRRKPIEPVESKSILQIISD